MNLSGEAVARWPAATPTHHDPHRLVIVHDELDRRWTG